MRFAASSSSSPLATAHTRERRYEPEVSSIGETRQRSRYIFRKNSLDAQRLFTYFRKKSGLGAARRRDAGGGGGGRGTGRVTRVSHPEIQTTGQLCVCISRVYARHEEEEDEEEEEEEGGLS